MRLRQFALLLMVGLTVSCSQDRDFYLPDDQETFSQKVTRNGRVDILWVIDTSFSMQKHQEQLDEQAGPLIDFLMEDRRGIDFHMAAVTMDMGLKGDGGRFIGSPEYLTMKTPDLRSKIREKIVLGDDGGNMERGLESVKTLFEGAGNPLYSGFLREETPLIVIFLTNEDDQSSGLAQDYIDFLDGLRPPLANGQRGWRAHVVGVLDLSSECRTRYNFAEPAIRFMELSEDSGGTKGEICTADLRNVLGDIRAQIVSQLTDFEMSRVPVVESLVVEVDRYREVEWGVVEYVGRETVLQSEVDGWSYISEGNLLRFHGTAVPGEFDRLIVNFSPVAPK